MKKKYIVLIIVSLLIIILVSSASFYYLTRPIEMGPVNNNESVVSSMVSVPVIKENNVQDSLSFNYQQPTISIDKKYSDQIIKFSLDSADKNLKIKTLDPSHTIIEGEGYSIFIFGIGENNSTNGEVSSDNKMIGGKLGVDTYRVDSSTETNMKNFLANYNLNNYSYIGYYTDKYDVGCFNQFTSDKYCGTDSIRLRYNSKGIPYDVGIACFSNKLKINNCDEIVKNLEYKYLD